MDIVLAGAVIGMANALLAVGLVLIYKANRVINLAHGELGAFAVSMMFALSANAHWNYWASLGTSLLATCVLAAVVERVMLRRLFGGPRLILMLATIGVAQIIIVLRLVIPKPTTSAGQSVLAGGGSQFPLPFHFQAWHIGRIIIGPGHLLVLIVGPLAVLALFAFLRWSPYGVALRAAAENAQRARLLGIPVRRVSTLAWVIAGLLSAIAAILLAPIIGFSATEAVGLTTLMRGLAAAMVGRMESVGVAFWAGLGIGIIDRVLFYTTQRSGLTDVILFLVVLTVLLVRRRGSGRAGETDTSTWEAGEPLRPLPVEITAHAHWQLTRRIIATAGLFTVIALPFLIGPSSTFFLGSVLLVAAVAVSMTVLTGWAGQMSLGHWAFAGVGGVLGSRLVEIHHVNLWVTLVLVAIAGAAVAVAIGLPALRLEGSALAAVTLGFAVFAASWLFDQSWFSGGGFLHRPAYMTQPVYYAIAVTFLSGVVVLTYALQRSRVWRSIVASRDNPAQAASFGVSIVRAKLTAFALSGAIAAAAGYLWSLGIEHADGTVFPPVRSLTIVAAVVIGGLGSIPGAIVGAMYFRLLPYFAGQYASYVSLLTTGFGLLLLLNFVPGGLARGMYVLRDMVARAVTGIDPRPKVVPVSSIEATAQVVKS
ncbi:MAG: ABC transporter permease [Actinomycetota bacterium]